MIHYYYFPIHHGAGHTQNQWVRLPIVSTTHTCVAPEGGEETLVFSEMNVMERPIITERATPNNLRRSTGPLRFALKNLVFSM